MPAVDPAARAAAVNPRATAAPCSTIPPTATRSGPNRSASHPKTGLNANIPSTCRLITMPTSCSDIPPCCMCTGVITITMIITPCATAVVTTANRARGCAQAHRSAASAPVRRGSVRLSPCPCPTAPAGTTRPATPPAGSR